MHLNRARVFTCSCLLLLTASAAFAQAVDVPLRNWTVPAYRSADASEGLSPMVDLSPGVAFVAVTPCRIVDTRGGGVFTGTYGPPALVGNAAARPFDINSAAHCPGIPAGADAYSLNFTVIAAAGAFQNAFLTAWPTGGAQPVVSTLNFNAGQLVANAAIVPAGTNGSINVFVNAPGHLLIDINGYFADTLGSNQFEVRAGGGTAIYGENTGSGYGVWGTSASGYGVVAGGGAGGVWATTNGDGVSGVYGQHVPGGLARGYGVYGFTSGSAGSAGVLGVGAGGRAGNPGSSYPAVPGVRGEARDGFGVLGLTAKTGNIEFSQGGVRGIVFDLSANQLASGYLGYALGGTHHGVVSDGSAAVFGNLTVTGNFSSANKWFIEPHPHDASKEIRYVSLEGPHAEVYFRGTAQIRQGLTRIEIPESFLFVADPDTYSTLVTPVGGMASVGVVSEGKDGIVVQASRNLKIHYVVYAERKAIKNPDPIVENVHFRPQGNLDVFGSLPDSYRRLLIQNGTLNPDGSLNVETAKRFGWPLPTESETAVPRAPSD